MVSHIADESFDEFFSDDVSVASSQKDLVDVGQESQEKLGNESSAYSVQDTQLPFGSFVSDVPIPKFRAVKIQKSRISIVEGVATAIRMHYVPGIGSFKCFGGACCQNEGNPRVRYIIPIVEYETNSKGVILKGSQSVTLKVLSLGRESYSALCDAVEMSSIQPEDTEIVVSCSDEQYQKMSFAIDMTVRGSSWRKFPCAQSVMDLYRANIKNLSRAVVKTIDERTYLSKKGLLAQQEQE